MFANLDSLRARASGSAAEDVLALDALSQLVFRIDDRRERDAIRDALQGPGGPAGVAGCDEDAKTLTVSFDATRTSPSLVRHLVEIERRRFSRENADGAARELDDAGLARLVAEAIHDPELDENRILEHLVPELNES